VFLIGIVVYIVGISIIYEQSYMYQAAASGVARVDVSVGCPAVRSMMGASRRRRRWICHSVVRVVIVTRVNVAAALSAQIFAPPAEVMQTALASLPYCDVAAADIPVRTYQTENMRYPWKAARCFRYGNRQVGGVVYPRDETNAIFVASRVTNATFAQDPGACVYVCMCACVYVCMCVYVCVCVLVSCCVMRCDACRLLRSLAVNLMCVDRFGMCCAYAVALCRGWRWHAACSPETNHACSYPDPQPVSIQYAAHLEFYIIHIDHAMQVREGVCVCVCVCVCDVGGTALSQVSVLSARYRPCRRSLSLTSSRGRDPPSSRRMVFKQHMAPASIVASVSDTPVLSQCV
jgi:hypothetical protein